MGRVSAPPVDPALPPVSPPSAPARRGWLCDLRVGAAVTGAVTAAGLLGALAWWLVAPTPAVRSVEGGVQLVAPNGKAWVGNEGWFVVVAVVVAVACAAVAYRWTRRHGVAVVIGLAVGGLLASLVMWRVGVWLGPDPLADQARHAAPGAVLHLPLALRAKGVLFAWPLVSVVITFGLVAGLQQPDPAPTPTWSHWTAPGQPASPWAPPER
jgi:hypothetical protein